MNNKDITPEGEFRKKFGGGGESMAESFLTAKGFRPLARNYLTHFGELDLVMTDGKALVFVEVKRRSNSRYGEPEEAILPSKMRHMVKAALQYVQRSGTVECMLRFDVVCISGNQIRHYPNAFDAGGDYWY